LSTQRINFKVYFLIIFRLERDLVADKIAQEKRVHESILKFLADQRKVLELEIQDWMQKYEEDTGKYLILIF
jgi:hypothetical protein